MLPNVGMYHTTKGHGERGSLEVIKEKVVLNCAPEWAKLAIQMLPFGSALVHLILQWTCDDFGVASSKKFTCKEGRAPPSNPKRERPSSYVMK